MQDEEEKEALKIISIRKLVALNSHNNFLEEMKIDSNYAKNKTIITKNKLDISSNKFNNNISIGQKSESDMNNSIAKKQENNKNNRNTNQYKY